MKRLEVREKLKSYSLDSFEGRPLDVGEWLIHLEEEFPNHNDIRLEFWWDDDYSDNRICLMGYRKETDKEYNRRMAKREKELFKKKEDKEKIRQKELKTLERLK